MENSIPIHIRATDSIDCKNQFSVIFQRKIFFIKGCSLQSIKMLVSLEEAIQIFSLSKFYVVACVNNQRVESMV